MISAITSSLGISDVFSLLIIFIITYTSRYYYNYFTRQNPLPGPFPIPILGNIHQKIGLEYSDWMISLHKKYGDLFEINLPAGAGGGRMIILCRTDLIENLFVTSTKTKYPIKFKIPEGFFELGIDGTGLSTNNDYKSWKYHRQFFNQAMVAPSFNHQAIEWTNELWEEMEIYWHKLLANNSEFEFDLVKWTRRFVNEMIFKISTGVKNDAIFSYYSTFVPENSLNEKEKMKIEESEKFILSIQTYVSGLAYFIFFNKYIRHYVPFMRGKTHKLLKNKDYLINRIMNVIKERRIEIENTPLDQPLHRDMLTSFLTANTSRDINNVKQADPDLLRPMTNKEVFGNIFDALRAGSETTANLFCFTVYYLGQYPEVKQRLRQELETVLGKDLTKPITIKELDELQYCDAVIKEVSRHCPVVFMLSRVNSEKDEVGGFSWPEGTSFQALYAAIMKHENYWTEPEKFDPYRFYKIEESDKYLLEKQHVKNAFNMFGGGPKICPGRKLAMIEMKFLLSSIYRKYDIELADINAPLKYKSNLTGACTELIVKIRPRK